MKKFVSVIALFALMWIFTNISSVKKNPKPISWNESNVTIYDSTVVVTDSKNDSTTTNEYINTLFGKLLDIPIWVITRHIDKQKTDKDTKNDDN